MFNSRNPLYRYPMGAVEEETPVHFKISIGRDLHCSAMYFCVIDDSSSKEEKYSMFWCGMNGENAEFWECDYAPPHAGLFFYHFEGDTWHGRQRYMRGMYGQDQLGGDKSWQLTAYRHGFSTPDWLAGGVMYQIFPDRFHFSGNAKDQVPEDRRYHEIWDEQPQWEPDPDGEIRNKDYFRGDLEGIIEKLDYLQSLGVTCLYLNPIFEAHSNHRYDTADYSKIDPLLGTEQDFSHLCREATKYGIRIILDGVFNHTGSDSVYFNREGRYSGAGAYQSQQSPYYPWYSFRKWPDEYDCWWNFKTLPDVVESNPQYKEYITGEKGIIRKWLADGSSGWRLDVADELPDEFLDSITSAARLQNSESLIIGEVWEDASNKCAYGQRRRYLLGGQLDSVMNYPFRNAILGFLTGGDPSAQMELILEILENYPPQVIRLLMNHIGTHDTERALTMLAGEPLRGHGRKWQSTAHLTKDRRAHGLRLLRLAALMQYTLPGVPCVYYGDEAGMEGYRDPFNRGTYPWGNEDRELLGWYRQLGKLRKKYRKILAEGDFSPLHAGNSCMAYLRSSAAGILLAAFNACGESRSLAVPSEWKDAYAEIGNAPSSDLVLPPYGCAVLISRGTQGNVKGE